MPARGMRLTPHTHARPVCRTAAFEPAGGPGSMPMGGASSGPSSSQLYYTIRVSVHNGRTFVGPAYELSNLTHLDVPGWKVRVCTHVQRFEVGPVESWGPSWERSEMEPRVCDM